MQNLFPVFQKTIATICEEWDEIYSKKSGFKISANRKSITKTHLFVTDLFTKNTALPPDPGPFKIAAAFLVVGMHFIQFNFIMNKGVPEMTKQQQEVWKSRIFFKAISIFLLQLELTKTKCKLQKTWDAPSAHYRMDFLNFIRWCEFPMAGPDNPPPPNKPTVSLVRLNRLVMAVTLIIEACYYLSGNETKCDVKNQVHIKLNDLDADCRIDLEFDC